VSHLILKDGEVHVRGTVHRVTVAEGPGGVLVPVPVDDALRALVVDGGPGADAQNA
jgi:hypothetical protein